VGPALHGKDAGNNDPAPLISSLPERHSSELTTGVERPILSGGISIIWRYLGDSAG
jgi:hypothetical protein